MKSCYYIFLREIKQCFANRYLLAMIILLASLGLTLVMIGGKSHAAVKVDRLIIQVASLSSLSIFLVPLIALFISYDGVVGEKEQGRLILDLSYPVSRFQWLLGKFMAHSTALFIAVCFGYAIAILPIIMDKQITATSIYAFLRLLYSSTLLGMTFISIGYIISAIHRQRSTAAGTAIGCWLFFVMLYDLALLGILVSETGKTLKSSTIDLLLVLNPVDVFRMMSLNSEQTNQLSAMQALGEVSSLSPLLLMIAFVAWIVVPLLVAMGIFAKSEV